MQGRVIAGRYRLESLLGRGGGGAVWRAVHVDLGTAAAIKLLHRSDSPRPEALARFRREARAAASLRCSNVVQILDYGVEDGTPYIAMELLEGESLAARMARRGRLSPRETAQIVVQVARAVDQAHEQGIVHRDLKPDNIFMARDGGQEIVKVLDFGIAKATGGQNIEDDLSTQTGAVLGTPLYMSLEQVLGDKTVDHRTDVWALAVIACECLTGKRPFVADTFGNLVLLLSSGTPPRPSEFAPVPVGFDLWFSRCTARQANERYESIKEAAAVLEVLVGSGELTEGASSVLRSDTTSAQFASASTVSADELRNVATGPGVDPAGTTRRRRAARPLRATLGVAFVLAISTGYWLTRSPGTDAENARALAPSAVASLAVPDPAPSAVPPKSAVVPTADAGASAQALPAAAGSGHAAAADDVRPPPASRQSRATVANQPASKVPRNSESQPTGNPRETPAPPPSPTPAGDNRELLKKRVGF